MLFLTKIQQNTRFDKFLQKNEKMPRKKTNTRSRTPKRLDFLTEFMTLRHIDTTDIAEKLNITRTSVYCWFRDSTDDVRLSYATRIIEDEGFNLQIQLFRDEKDLNEPFYAKVNDLVTDGGDIRLSRLSFLSLTLRRYGITIKDATSRMGVNTSNWRYWLKNDDIYLSRIYQLADVCGLNIRFLITQKPSADGSASKRGRCLTEIHSTSVSDIAPLACLS